jgi:hypothetical protein
MTSKERAMTMLNHQKPDRIPKFDGFWAEFVALSFRFIYDHDIMFIAIKLCKSLLLKRGC